MPDRRTHRGPHPDDRQLFGDAELPDLRRATDHLSWLLSHDYASVAALKIVGDHFQLASRQRLAVARCAAADASVAARKSRLLPAAQLSGQSVLIDGYNLLTTIEAALSGGVIIVGRDGCYRDMASMHGTYRKVEETCPAIVQIGKAIEHLQVVHTHWLLDRPVSNSGRLAAILRDTADTNRWNWTVELVPDPDAVMRSETGQRVNVTADSVILEASSRWFNLARHIIDAYIADAWIVDLSLPCDDSGPTSREVP